MNQLCIEGFEPEEEKQASQKEKREPEKINLYWCYDTDWEDRDSGAFVFASTPNKARYMYVKEYYYPPYGDYYTYIRAICYKNDVGGEPEVCDCDCERLAKLGYASGGVK